MGALNTVTLQYTWPIIDPAPGAPLTRSEVLALAYPELEAVADEYDCTIMGPPVWDIQPAAVTPGWKTWPGRVVIARIPVEYHPSCNAEGDPLLTRAEWEEVHAAEAAAEEARQEAERAAQQAAQKARRDAIDVQVRRLYGLGLGDAEAARVIGDGCQRGDVCKSRNRLGLPFKRRAGAKGRAKNGHIATPQDQRVTELYRGGLTVAEIARALDVARSVVQASVERLELDSDAEETSSMFQINGRQAA